MTASIFMKIYAPVLSAIITPILVMMIGFNKDERVQKEIELLNSQNKILNEIHQQDDILKRIDITLGQFGVQIEHSNKRIDRLENRVFKK